MLGLDGGGLRFLALNHALRPDDPGSFHKSTAQGTCPCRETGLQVCME